MAAQAVGSSVVRGRNTGSPATCRVGAVRKAAGGTAGGPNATPGVFGTGGDGGDQTIGAVVVGGGGGGGGGWYGGGGGYGAGGGGGSGHGPVGTAFETGVRSGNGLITITYERPLFDSAPASLSFGTPTPVPQGTVSAPKTVTYTNTGSLPLSINGLDISGADADEFTAELGDCGNVPPGQSCTAQVRFAPQAVGSRSATLTALSDAEEDPTTTLSGNAGPPPPPVITEFRVVPKRFAASDEPTASSRKAPARIKLTLSKDATVVFKARRKPPANVGAPPPKNPRRFKAQLSEGQNSIPFTGKIGDLKLKPGRYRLRARARDSHDQWSERVSTTFRIVEPS